MAIPHNLTDTEWSDLGPVPLYVQRQSVGGVFIDYATVAPAPSAVGVVLDDAENCQPNGAGDVRHVFARAMAGSARVVVIAGYVP